MQLIIDLLHSLNFHLVRTTYTYTLHSITKMILDFPCEAPWPSISVEAKFIITQSDSISITDSLYTHRNNEYKFWSIA